MSPETTELIRILAGVDSLFAPLRTTHRDGVVANRNDAEVFHRRIDYTDRGGLLWKVGGTMSDRQAGSRLLRRLADGGLLELRGDGRSRRAKLTAKGGDVARQVSGGFTLWSVWPMFVSIEQAGKDDDRSENGWILESQLLPENPTPAGICENNDALSPLLAADYLNAARDTIGMQWYRVTGSGENALSGPRPAITPEVDFVKEAGVLYNAAYAEFRTARDSWQPESNTCFIPLPLSTEAFDWIPSRAAGI